MKIGFLGAGVVAQTIAKHVLQFGHQVMLIKKQTGSAGRTKWSG
jgi:3-hydroxyisobutyrate dehydrogenase-like beta-hydroxyacid dehydrogenase